MQDPLKPKERWLDIPFKNFMLLAHFNLMEKPSLQKKKSMIVKRWSKNHLNPPPRLVESQKQMIAACAIMIIIKGMIK